MTILDLLENFLVIEEISNKYKTRQRDLEEIEKIIYSIKEESGDD